MFLGISFEEIILIKLKHFYDENSEKGECDKLFYCSKKLLNKCIIK